MLEQENDASDSDMLGISYLNALEYCPRRFYYECVLHEFIENAHTIEGTMNHARSDSGYTTMDDGVTTLRRVWIGSSRLRLSGFADVVEIEHGQFIPVEYKKGKMGIWLNDHVQLCAQALCLEEMTHLSIPVGAIFYVGSARREEVVFSEALRAHTEEVITQAFTLIEQHQMPLPLEGKRAIRSCLPQLHPKCRDCSLEPLCMPREVLFLGNRPEILSQKKLHE
ncbi:CRISPR-associated protein Cas4 [Dictyobacter aurantiacus]|uniref:CRISPR-associated exonuclease Cas4 n=1 Tax=Dictyobacter aurantiacus TaxID=1936993 RepID=A0A401ZR73_9CHLR|nr:CRISPR-associated protein Cas4 [Dictyobacter aurantiacus]GCE09284.1 CRISPR-associated protein Cas4 [Dictyobacter aurantiacus]